jgi:hypothetical protein
MNDSHYDNFGIPINSRKIAAFKIFDSIYSSPKTLQTGILMVSGTSPTPYGQ